MIGIASAIALATVLVGGYQLSCAGRTCAVRSPQLSFRVERVGSSLVVRPVSMLIQGAQNHGAPDWIKETAQYRIVPDFCATRPNRCHYLFGPGAEVVKWSEREDSANRVSTRVALNEIGRARRLSISANHATLDVVRSVGFDIPAAGFLAAVRAADARLRASRR